jgi:hypothetical protein
MGDADEIPEEVWELDSVVEIPHKNDLELGRNLVFVFAESLTPDDYDHVRDIFRRKGAYYRKARFRLFALYVHGAMLAACCHSPTPFSFACASV